MAGVGVGIVDIERVRRVMLRTPRFALRVFTEEERAWCAARPNPYAAYAGCFAARVAVLKALDGGFGSGVAFSDVSVGHDERGKPVVVLAGGARVLAAARGVVEVYLSITHTRTVAVANAVAATPSSQPRREERVREKDVLAAQFRQARQLLDDLDRKEGDA